MALVLTSAPAIEPVTLAEAKAHLRVDGSAEDTLILSLIVTSRLHIEAALGLALVTQSWSYFLDAWPARSEVALPVRPVQSIAAVKLYAADESVTTVPADTYLLDGAGSPPRLVRRASLAWPSPGKVANVERGGGGCGDGLKLALEFGLQAGGEAGGVVAGEARQAVEGEGELHGGTTYGARQPIRRQGPGSTLRVVRECIRDGVLRRGIGGGRGGQTRTRRRGRRRCRGCGRRR